MRSHFVLLGSAVLFVSSLVACSGSDTSSTTTPTSASPDGGKPKVGGGTTKEEKDEEPKADAGTKKPQPKPGTKTCKAAALCIDNCPGDDFDCQSECLDGMSDAENKKLQQVWLCIGESGCTDDECVQEVCAEQIQKCIGE